MLIESQGIVSAQATASLKKQESAAASQNKKTWLTTKNIKGIALGIFCSASAVGLAILLAGAYRIKTERDKRLEEENLGKKDYDSCLKKCRPVEYCLVNAYSQSEIEFWSEAGKPETGYGFAIKFLETCTGCRNVCSENLLKRLKVI